MVLPVFFLGDVAVILLKVVRYLEVIKQCVLIFAFSLFLYEFPYLLSLPLILTLSLSNWVDSDKCCSVLIILEKALTNFSSQRLNRPSADLQNSKAPVLPWLKPLLEILILFLSSLLKPVQVVPEVHIRPYRLFAF